MALFINQDEDRTELQKRLATELQEKMKLKDIETDLPDGVDDSQYIKGTQKSNKFTFLWFILILIIVAVIVYLTIESITG